MSNNGDGDDNGEYEDEYGCQNRNRDEECSGDDSGAYEDDWGEYEDEHECNRGEDGGGDDGSEGGEGNGSDESNENNSVEDEITIDCLTHI
jgi:hypothetical protein